VTTDADKRSMRDRMLAGELYIADDPELAEQHLHAMDLTEAFNTTSSREPHERHRLLTELLGAIGPGAA
jgi:maltose O-acetyltransferase